LLKALVNRVSRRQCILAAGLNAKTRVHGLGDGARWIIDQFGEQFGAQGTYLVDFYHSSEYLAGAAPVMNQRQPKMWLRRQQGRLLSNRLGSVLKSLLTKQEPKEAAESPVRDAHRYLTERANHLDYAGARKANLPIGSGEIESGHRHVIQQRLKLSGAWWRERNAEAMLSLRVCRANQTWLPYWTNFAAIEN